MTENRFSASSRHRDLNKATMNIPSEFRIASIAPNHALILPNDANPGRMQFSERTGQFHRTDASKSILLGRTSPKCPHDEPPKASADVELARIMHDFRCGGTETSCRH